MKIGRNDPCPCGSGKKYKKCCLDNDEKEEQSISYDKHYFELKGKNAESFVYELAQKSFLTDWCYINPELEKGKELCDLLVVFGETAIIWQIKDLKRGEDGKYNRSEVDKSLRQISGAKRMLFESNKKIMLKNPRRGEEEFNPQSIKEVYLISALVGEESEDFFEFVKKVKNKTVHILNKEGTEILLNELDTIKDFIGYLKEKENFLSLEIEINLMGGEEELLAYYLMNERSFSKLKEAQLVMIQEGCWENFQSKPEVLARNEENKISYFWDMIINEAHLSKDPKYELIAREMAKLNRFERRCKSKQFIEGHKKAQMQENKNFFKRTLEEEGITYCFVYADAPSRNDRKNILGSVCLVTRNLFKNNSKVLGIATDFKPSPFQSFELCLLDFPEWGEAEEKHAEKLRETLGIYKNQEVGRFTEDEYPIIANKK